MTDIIDDNPATLGYPCIKHFLELCIERDAAQKKLENIMNPYFREETINGVEYWVDVKAGLIYQESLLFDHFGADIVDLKTYLPLFLESRNGGTRLPDGLRWLNPKLTAAEWRRCLELMTRFGEYSIRQADTEAQILRYMELHDVDTLQEAVDKYGQHSVEKSLGIRL